MDRFQDVKISDASLLNNYRSYFLNGNYNDAFSLLNDPQLNKKKVVADTFNSISNILSILQNYYKINVTDFLSGELNILQNIIDNYKYIGTYDSSVTYRIYNYVGYQNKYYMYINNTPSSNVSPTNSTYWVELDLTGEEGAPSYGLNFKYDWQSDFNYRTYDVVYYNDCLWVAYSDSYNIAPSEQSGNPWQILIRFYESSIYCDAQPSANVYNGLIWFQII